MTFTFAINPALKKTFAKYYLLKRTLPLDHPDAFGLYSSGRFRFFGMIGVYHLALFHRTGTAHACHRSQPIEMQEICRAKLSASRAGTIHQGLNKDLSTTPKMESTSTKPNVRLSEELFLLSPRTKTHFSGTTHSRVIQPE